MSFEEQFDKRVKQKIESAEFPFDEANWAKAAAFLDADKALTKVGNTTKFIVITLGLVTFISFGTYIALNYKEARKLANKNADKIKSEKFESNAKEIGVLNGNSVSDEVNNDVKNPTIEPQTTSKVYSKESVEKINETETDEKGNLAPYQETNSENSKNKAIISKFVRAESNLFASQTKEQTFAQSKIVSPEVNNGSSSLNVTSKELSVISDSQQLGSQDVEIVNSNAETIGDSGNSDVNSTLNTPPSNISEYVESSPDAGIPTTLFGENGSQYNSEIGIYQLSCINVNSNISGNDNDVKHQTISLLQRYEEDYYKKGVKYKTHFFNIEAGVNYWLGWNVTNQKDAKGFDWFAGVNYAYYLSKRIAIGMGFQMFNMNHISQPFYATEKTDYSFSSIKTSTIITTNQLNYLAVPIKLYYRINRFNQVSIGLNTAYVYKTLNKVERVTPESAPVVVQNNIIYNDIQSLNYNLTLSYRVRTFNRWWLSFEGMYGLSDVFHGNLNPSNFERPIGLRIGLQYNVLDK